MTRNEVIKGLEQFIVDFKPFCGNKADWRRVSDALALLKAEPKRGRWLTCEDGWGDEHYQCSECGCEWCLNDGTPKENGMNYCPHCGAKMEADT